MTATLTAPVAVQNWMSWEGGVDIAVSTQPNMPNQNLIIHVARMVHTPLGSAPAGMVFYQPNETQPPAFFGFVCTDERIGRYFGANIFAGTPFETAPVLKASIEVTTDATKGITQSVVSFEGFTLETTLTNLAAPQLISREPSGLPFYQQVLEAKAGSVQVKINGQIVDVVVPEVALNGAYGAAFSPTGLYARK